MKLLGRDIPARELLARLEERLRARGLAPSEPTGARAEDEGVEPRVDPLSFNLAALEEHADATRGLPLETHRGGAGRAVLVAKWAFRRAGQVFINEALGRQRIFNGLVRDSYAQLAAEVLRLREEVARLRAERDAVLLTRAPAPAASRAPAERAPAARAAAPVTPAPARATHAPTATPRAAVTEHATLPRATATKRPRKGAPASAAASSATAAPAASDDTARSSTARSATARSKAARGKAAHSKAAPTGAATKAPGRAPPRRTRSVGKRRQP